MAKVSFSVPDEVKRAFNAAFSGTNKSAVIAELMMEAVARHRRQERRKQAVNALLEIRKGMPSVSDEEIRIIRDGR